MFNAFNVVSSREAARQPSSVEPPSHIPANAAMLLIINTQNSHRLVLNITNMYDDSDLTEEV